jgi:LuxR family maltose regulon positive regulatory protein
MAALNRAAQKRVTIISAPAGTGKTSLLRAWADHPGQDCHIAFTTVRPGQHDMQLYGLSKAATGADGELQAAAAELQPVTVQPATVQPREELVARAAAARPCRYC